MDNSLYAVIYISSAAVKFTSESLTELLRSSRAHNEAHHITGLLLFRDGAFMQMIEGPRTAVTELYARICRDPRHTEIITLDEGPRAKREFADWSMGFRDLQSEEARQVPGFSPFLDTPLSPEALSGKVSTAMSLLLAFKSP